MARAFVNDKYMPRSYWFWAIRHAARVHNIFPIRHNDTITTHHELVYHTKPDYRQLFRLFYTAYFSHTKNGTHKRTNVQSHSMQGIAVGWSDVANVIEIYNPVTKQLYTTTIYKLDEHSHTKSHFNLTYDGGIFSDLLSMDTNKNIPEPYPIGTTVTTSSTTGFSTGYILAVPAAQPASNDRITLSRSTQQGRLILSQENECFFIKKNKLGETVFKHHLPHFQFNYQSLLNSTTLQPGWTPSTKITANHVTAKSLKNNCPLSLDKAINTANPD